jgi:nucleotide-binding universal stress UspA family protein
MWIARLDAVCLIRNELSVIIPAGTTAVMQTIVVSFDESEPAERAVARASDLAEAFDATLVVVAVAEPPLPGSGIDVFPGAPERLASEATEEFDLAERRLERARRLLEGRAVRAEFVADVGEHTERILKLADQRSADLIVVGLEGAGFLERLLERSLGEDVAHRTLHDVLIVH